MSLTNAISGIVMLAGITFAAHADDASGVLAAVASAVGAVNVCGGFWVVSKERRGWNEKEKAIGKEGIDVQ